MAVSKKISLLLTMAKLAAALSASALVANVPSSVAVLARASSAVLSEADITPARAEVAAASVITPASPVSGLVNTKRTEVVVGTLCS